MTKIKIKMGKKTKVLTVKKQGKKKTTISRKSGAIFKGRQSLALARMISDPCNAPLVPGTMGGNGIIARVRTSRVTHSVAANNCGYVVWFPAFHNSGAGAGAAGNYFFYEPAASATQCTNSVANPLGTTLATSGDFVVDPAYGWVNQTSVADPGRLRRALSYTTTALFNLVKVLWLFWKTFRSKRS